MPSTVLSPLCAFYLCNPQDDFTKLVFYSHLKDEGTNAARKRQGEDVHPGSLDSTTLPSSLTVLRHL